LKRELQQQQRQREHRVNDNNAGMLEKVRRRASEHEQRRSQHVCRNWPSRAPTDYGDTDSGD
jgi:hypothetical protein